jgi:hypothetical protein
MPSFGGEVKLSVPCRRFAACKRSLHLPWESHVVGKIGLAISCPYFLPSLIEVSHITGHGAPMEMTSSENPSPKIIMPHKRSSAARNTISTRILLIDHLWLYYALWLLDIVFGMPLSGVTWPLIWLGEADQLNHLHKAVKLIWFLNFGLTHSPKEKVCHALVCRISNTHAEDEKCIHFQWKVETGHFGDIRIKIR